MTKEASIPMKEDLSSPELTPLRPLEERFASFEELCNLIQSQLDQYSYEELLDDELLQQSLRLPNNSRLLGVGTMSIAVNYEDAVLRFPKTDSEATREELVRHRLSTIPWGAQSIEGVEEIMAISKERGIVVTTYIDGKPASRGTASDLLRIGYEDIVCALDIINKMYRNGYCLDSEPANIILRREVPNGQRLAFIDPMSLEEWPQRTVQDDIATLMHSLSNMVRNPIEKPNIEYMVRERLALFEEISEANSSL